MSTAPAVTMEELELERAELLPSRETLYVVGDGNTAQFGLLNVAILNGSVVNIPILSL